MAFGPPEHVFDINREDSEHAARVAGLGVPAGGEAGGHVLEVAHSGVVPQQGVGGSCLRIAHLRVEAVLSRDVANMAAVVLASNQVYDEHLSDDKQMMHS